MLIGCHISIAGGIENIFERASDLGNESIQIFTQNQRQWKSIVYSDSKIEKFMQFKNKYNCSLLPIISHASYLINLCAGEKEKLEKSRTALYEELIRCTSLGVSALVIHPGSHGGKGERWGMDKIIESIQNVYERSNLNVRLLLETTAGQGNSIGYKFEQLAYILNKLPSHIPTGICVDTCHIFAAGYDLRSAESYNSVIEQLGKTVGLQNVNCWHLNDSLKPFASKRDRHAEIGMGEIGLKGFRLLMNDKRFKEVPGILETPGGEEAFRKNIQLCKDMRLY